MSALAKRISGGGGGSGSGGFSSGGDGYSGGYSGGFSASGGAGEESKHFTSLQIFTSYAEPPLNEYLDKDEQVCEYTYVFVTTTTTGKT